MPENGESLVNRLLRENDLLTKHCESWARDYKSLASKLDASDRENARLKAELEALIVGQDGASPQGVPGSEVLCEECAKVFCPHGEQLHFHHDGCPACAIRDLFLGAS